MVPVRHKDSDHHWEIQSGEGPARRSWRSLRPDPTRRGTSSST